MPIQNASLAKEREKREKEREKREKERLVVYKVVLRSSCSFVVKGVMILLFLMCVCEID